ncbi:hypothetical protein NC796_05450 [Aliifodinibius sp. S!AR15-10]|uniref:hypothetical protein n=1 Tax=Aliifodinibius sp. S!AR15-10 TaxID=2950437 RepID=UPI0028645F66|nr:hypothetical protein [Aliifodinibius sp. S!AR15-10]MDR8390577.1 hypothetical protein [Aliifodinibius sp. S!AR15-10]
MKINFVSREDIRISKKSSSKYKPLLEAVKELEAGGKALEVKFSDDTELNSMRNVIYSYNRETGDKIKSSKHPKKNLVYFYKEEE